MLPTSELCAIQITLCDSADAQTSFVSKEPCIEWQNLCQMGKDAQRSTGTAKRNYNDSDPTESRL